MDDFDKPKIVYTPVNSEYRFCLVPERFIFNNSLFMITGEDLEIICALCNSSLFQFYLAKILSSGNYQYGSGIFFESLPLVKVSNNQQKKEIISLVTSVSKENSSDILQEIDRKVYELYGLTDKEIEFIENII